MPCSICRQPLIQDGRRWVCPDHGGKDSQSVLYMHPDEGAEPTADEWRSLDALEARLTALAAALVALTARVAALEEMLEGFSD